MTEIQKHFSDANGNHFVASFFKQSEIDAYKPPAGAIEIEPPPSAEHRWVNGAWVYVAPPEPTPEPTDEQKLERLFASVGLSMEKGMEILNNILKSEEVKNENRMG